jgi:fumarate reductase subunit D
MSVTAHHRGAGFYAFMAHRLSGLALAIFLPLHFLALGLALEASPRFDEFLLWSDRPIVKAAEWVLTILVTTHLTLGLRILLIEMLPWRGQRLKLVGAAAGCAALVALLFIAVVV